MRFASLALVFALAPVAACTSPPEVSGSYTGTLTLTRSSGTTVVTTLANILPEQISVELSATAPPPDASCTIQGMTVDGTALRFDCGAHTCSCSLDAEDLTVGAATGSVAGDVLTVDFSGEATGGTAYTGTFMGSLEPGTR